MSPAIRMTISFVPVQDHDNKSGSEMMLRATVLRGVVYGLGRSRSSILHHYCRRILLSQQWIEYASLPFVNAMEPVAVRTHHGDRFGSRLHPEFGLLVRLHWLDIYFKKPMKQFAEQLVRAVGTASRSSTTHHFLPTPVATVRARSEPEAASQPHFAYDGCCRFLSFCDRQRAAQAPRV
jgi:hypothetical protein